MFRSLKVKVKLIMYKVIHFLIKQPYSEKTAGSANLGHGSL